MGKMLKSSDELGFLLETSSWVLEYLVFVMESSWVSLGAAMLSSSELYELYFPQSR